jgi:LysR family hydrogen peroxide-inducible transcriptional activator
MTINQLEYVITVDSYRHFATAAEKCYVTQPTLSMQIQKLEEEIGITIFNRKTHPVIPTVAGIEIIKLARTAIREFKKINEMVKAIKKEIKGRLRIGIIPTLAPYLLPLFIEGFIAKYSEIELVIDESITEEITRLLKTDILDIGIISTPLNDNELKEIPLFYEKIYLFIDSRHYLAKQQHIKAKDIPVNDLWTLSSRHCFSSQVVNLCKKSKTSEKKTNFHYQSGSFENLIRFSEITHRLTLIPELLTTSLTENKKALVKEISDPVPAREISIITHKSFVKENLVNILKEEILRNVPPSMKSREGLEIIEWK